jgi:REP element-mobilizing transposase RayT
MPKKPLVRSDLFPYHVVNRCNNREWFALPMEIMWRLMTYELYRMSVLTGARIHAFVLMSNHYHLLISTPKEDLGCVMREFGRSATLAYNRISGRTGHLFSGRYRESMIRTATYYSNALKYIYRNPVRAEAVRAVEDYPYSSLYGQLGKQHLPFPVWHPQVERLGINLVPEHYEDLVDWLNETPNPQDQEAIRRALRRRVFKLPRNLVSGYSNTSLTHDSA